MATPVLRPTGRRVVRRVVASPRQRQRRRMLLFAGAGTLLVVGFSSLLLIAASILLFVPLGSEDDSADQNCEVVGGGTGGLTADQLSREQLSNAETIMRTGENLEVPEYGWVIALATAMQESTLRNINYGDRDSVGLFQQRAAWGSRADRMNPEKSTTMFFTGGQEGQPGLLDIDGWEQMPVTVAAQRVQRSAFPDAYAQHEPLARDLVSQYGGNVGEDCGPIGETCPETPWPQTEAGLTPDAKLVMRCTYQQWSDIETIHGRGDRPAGGDGDHAAGRAVDFMIPFDDYRSNQATEWGWGVVEWLQANHERFGIKYLIYDKKIWSVGRADEGWRDYEHYDGCGSDTCLHYDHIHVSVYGNAARTAPGDWTLPIAAGDYELTSRFGECGDRWSNCHTGLDFAASSGTPVMAAARGEVVDAGPTGGPYGTMVTIAHADGMETYYAHLSSIVSEDLVGQQVQPGMMIGEVGSSGNSTGPHLHFEVRQLGTPIDPEDWFESRGVNP